METDSENTPKPKRGRPKSSARIYADFHDAAGRINPDIQTTRGKVNSALGSRFVGAWLKADEELQIRIMGFAGDALKSGTSPLPRGFTTAAIEITRWVETHDRETATQAALEIVAEARDKGLSWRDVKAHFRKLRLGEREGNAHSLTLHLSRAFDEYMSRFPATTRQAQAAAVRNLLEAIEDRDE
jgi:hypothetical protein